jgi:ABC-2 type transport system permease protein
MAGVGGAGLNGAGQAAAVSPGGLLSAQARVQYAAMANLRWRIFINGLRSRLGAFELGARIVVFGIYGAMGLGLGLGAGAMAYLVASERQWRFLPILFWGVCILWQMVPIMLASFQEQFDMSILLRFPVRFGSYYLLYVVFGLADVSTIIGGLCCLGIWAGITMARPELFAWTALALAIFALFNILLVRAVFAWIDRWLAQRRTREIVGAIFMALILSLQLLNPALHQKRHSGHATPQQRAEDYRQMRAKYQPWLETADAVQRWLPPGLGAQAIERAGQARPTAALASLGLFGIYLLAVGGMLAKRLGAEYRGENLGQAPKPGKTASRRSKAASSRSGALPLGADPARREGWGLPGSSAAIAAVIEKEVRALLRTLPLLWALGTPVLMVLILASLFRNSVSSAVNSFPFAMPLCVAYALLGFTQLFYNNLGAEGEGIQILFLSPTPIRTVLLAKNLFHGLLFFLDALLAGLLCTLRIGRPGGMLLAATAAWVLFALPSNLAAGNVFSLTMSYRINPGRMTRQRGSQSNALLALLIQLGVLGTGAAVFGLCWLFQKPWVAVPVFLALATGAVLTWLRVLANADSMANSRKDTMLATLMKES